MQRVVATANPVPAPRGGNYLGHLDALRGIAILGVILVHASIMTRQVGVSWILGFTGQRGVQLFYIISAFTLSLSLDSERKERFPLQNYFVRRFFRIAPLFYVAILANLLLKHVAPSHSSLSGLGRVDLLLGFLFLNGVRPQAINSVVAGGWSIAVETTFYLLLPWLHRYFNTLGRTLILFAVTAPVLRLLSGRLARAAADGTHEQYFAFLWFPVEFPVFVLGLLTYRVWQENIKGRENGSARSKDVSLLLILGSLLLYIGCLPFHDAQLYSSSFLFVPLVLALSLHAWPLLVNRATLFLGKISYSVYLVHFFVLGVVAHLLRVLDESPGHPISRYVYGRAWGLSFVVLLLLGISVPICMLTWMLVEQPGIGLGRRLIKWRERRGTEMPSGPLVPPLHDLESNESTPDSQF